MKEHVLPPSALRVRRHTKDEINQKIDNDTRRSISYYQMKPRSEVLARIMELDKEWDVERTLEANASTLILSSLSLYLWKQKRGFVLFSGVISAFLLQHALQGWCPPLALIRRKGVRTRAEIEEEKYGLLKILE